MLASVHGVGHLRGDILDQYEHEGWQNSLVVGGQKVQDLMRHAICATREVRGV